MIGSGSHIVRYAHSVGRFIAWVVVYVVSGRVRLQPEGDVLHPGAVFFIPAGAVHGMESVPGWTGRANEQRPACHVFEFHNKSKG